MSLGKSLGLHGSETAVFSIAAVSQNVPQLRPFPDCPTGCSIAIDQDRRQESAGGTVTFSRGVRSMPGSKLFSGPPSNKATASTIAAAATTLFWTIAAHTFWKSMSIADMTLYITTSTVILTAIVGFLIPESAAYTQHNSQRLATQAATRSSMTT